MKAIVKTKREFGAVEVRDVPEPAIVRDNHVKLQIKSVAVCGSDVHTYEYIPSSHYIPVPLIMGHEYSGVVVETGSKVTDFKVGDRVMGEAVANCGLCVNCRAGKSTACVSPDKFGLTVDGAMAEAFVVEDRFLHHLPDNVPFEDAAAAQPFAVSLHCVFDNCVVKPGDSVVVYGPGIIGNAAAQLANACGAGAVFLCGVSADVKERLAIADRLGLIPVNLEETPIEEAVKKRTGRSDVDVVIEASGSGAALAGGIKILRKAGCLSVVSIFPKPAEVALADLVRKEIHMRTSYTGDWTNYDRTLTLLSQGKLQIAPLIKTYDYRDAPKALEDAYNKEVLKPVLNF